MSDETPGAGQGALPPREGQGLRPSAERPAVRLTQVAGGQYVLTSQPHGIPALTQINPAASPGLGQSGVTRIISISPSRIGQGSPLRPSLANQSIVNVLKSRPNTNVRLQLFQNSDGSNVNIQHSHTARSPLKRPASSISMMEKKDTYATKMQRVMNHRIVRSKLVKEKFNEHLMETYFLETGGNILDLYQFSKRQKTQAYLNYLKEHSIDPKENETDNSSIHSQSTPSTPTATSASSLPGLSHSHSSSTHQTVSQASSYNQSDQIIVSTPKSTVKDRVKTPTNVPPTAANQEQIVEKAKQEAYVVQRIADLQKEGLWSEKRLPKVQEMPRAKAHWDFLLEEMVWLAADFAQERKWKKAAAKRCARMVQKYFQDKALAAQKAEKAQEQHLRRLAAFCAKEIKNFWNNVEKLVEYKQHTILEEKRKQALDQQLSFIVDQTEKYSQLLAEGMNRTTESNVPISTVSSTCASRVNSDDEFQPDNESSTDDEETIAQEEAAVSKAEHDEEIKALQKESEMDLGDILSDYLENRDNIKLSDDSDDGDADSSKTQDDHDFAVNTSEEDDEETIQEQEDQEGEQNYKDEVEELNAENELSIEDLKQKYNAIQASKEELPLDSSGESESEEEDEESELDEEEDEDTSGESDEDMEVSDEEKSDDLGLKMLVEESSEEEGEDTKTDKNNDLINDAAAIAESIQPKGNTLSSTSVSTKVPFLLKLPLREYQHIGLDWLVTMYERKLNGILADEMGLGKTIQTIALLAHLACEKENWGPHLIVVPTSVMLNWEMECKKWCPAFKILTYYGTQKERKLKRTGWTKPNAFHICITSYKLVIQDHQSFRRKKWKYLILDEAQNIKNFKSQRWQLLLNFQSQQRLLLTGTPLQNNLMELWSLMHFLMPNVFHSHREFKEWFSNPVTGMIEGNSEYNESIIKRLHKVLRPFLLRRLKSEVEKQMPKKYEHVVMCRLSKRQRFLYDDYMSRAKTRETLVSGNLLSVINVLMQLRKVCNHPNLFEVRPTISPFQCEGLSLHIPSFIYAMLDYDVWKHINLYSINLDLIMMDLHLSAYQCYRMRQLKTPKKIIEMNAKPNEPPVTPPCKLIMRVKKQEEPKEVKPQEKKEVAKPISQNLKLKATPHYGVQLIKAIPVVSLPQPTTSGNNTMPVTSILKPSDKLPTSFAQIVQTSTGKHLLLTSNPNLTGSMTVSTMAQGQKLALITKGVPTSNIAGIPKTFVKLQITSGPAITTTSLPVVTATTTSSTTATPKIEASKDQGRKTIGSKFIDELYNNLKSVSSSSMVNDNSLNTNNVGSSDDEFDYKDELKRRLELMARINEKRCSATPLYGKDFQQVVKVFIPNKIGPWSGGRNHCLNTLYSMNQQQTTDCLRDLMHTPERRIGQMKELTDRFIFYVPPVRAKEPEMQVWHPSPSTYWAEKRDKMVIAKVFSKPTTPLHSIASAMVTQFPDPRLIQYDCGKLQTMDRLLRTLKSEGHRVLIFTQMTKMLDVLEAFLNFHGHIYLRLDGSTRVDQRQVLMERFNGDPRIFAFILSTRSGGVGVNLTGADTVIFYDSDWNPTMDAQAQDRCHRIGQTRDVHIYRLVSERTIEENILKKANQKRLLGDLAIEGGNFTTAYFKSSTIQDLFSIDNTEESAANRMSEVVEMNKERERVLIADSSNVPSPLSASAEDKAAVGALESALASCEDDQDVQAARTAKAEAVADLAEFDENIPLEDADKEREPEMSKAEQEIDNVIKKLSPVERYAMKFIEETESAWSAEQLAAAEREIEEQKREWEQNRLAAMKEEEERRAKEMEEDSELLTFSREDATNQIWLSANTLEQMPMWCPPTPPQQETDVYIDHTMSFLYDTEIMSETQLPPVYIKKELKRSRLEAGLIDSRRALKIPRKEEPMDAPKSIFHSPHILKMRRDLKLQKFRGMVTRPLQQIMGKPTVAKPPVDIPLNHEWTIHEDVAILKVIQTFQGLPLNLVVMSAALTPNWDFVADYVNSVSIAYRSPKQCRFRYETVLMQREEGKQIFDTSLRKKKTKTNTGVQKFSSNRPMRSSQLYSQDNNQSFSQIMAQRYDCVKGVSSSRAPINKPEAATASLKTPKHTSVLNDFNIDLDHPILPVEIAARRAERIAREKKNMTPEQQMARLQLMKMQAGSQQVQASATTTVAQAAATSSAIQVVAASPSQPQQQGAITQTSNIVTTVTTAVASAPSTPPSAVRSSRILGSPMQNSTMVSVSGLSPAQLQAAGRLLVSSTPGQTKAVVGTAATLQGKTINQAQLQLIRQASLKQHLRLQSGGIQQATVGATGGVKTSTVTIGGQQAVIQFSQAQARPQFVRQGTMTVAGKTTGITRAVSDEVAQLLKKQQLQQQKAAMAAAVAASGGGIGTSQPTSIQNISPQVFAHAIQAGSSGTQVATMVKAVSSAGGTQTVSIPVSGVTLSAPGGKTITPTIKAGTNAASQQQLRQLHLQQQLLAQKKLTAGGQKLSIAQVTGAGGSGKGNIQTQLIMGPKPMSTAMTVQQFQQVIRSPLGVSQTPVMLTKSGGRVIPVNTGQGTKQTIQVVATSQALNTALRPQNQSTLAGALSGIKMPATSHVQQALLSQVSVALQGQNVRQGSPVRIQTSSGTPIVAVTVQNTSNMQQQGASPSTTNTAEQA